MRFKVSYLVVLAVFLCGISNAVPLNSNEEEAVRQVAEESSKNNKTSEEEVRQFAEESSKKLYALYDKLASDTLGLDEESYDSYLNGLDTMLSKSELVRDIVYNASKYDETKYNDPELNYILAKLKRTADEAILCGDQYFEMLDAEAGLAKLASDKDIAGYKNESIELAYFPDIQKIFVESNDPEEILYYWNTWRSKNERWAKKNFLKLVRAIKDVANVIGIPPVDYWMKDFNMTQMDFVMEQLEPSYRQFHAFIRHQLNKKYGDAVITNTGLIPDHLFQQVLAQTWSPESILEESFPYKELVHYDEYLVESNIDTLKIFKAADRFYESTGFEKIPESYWGKNIKMKTEEDKGDCKATIFAKTPNVFMQYCHKMDFRTFLQAHGYMAELHMAIERADLPAYYADSYDLDYTIGEAVILSASSTKYLNKIGLIQTLELTEKSFMNRFLRLSFHTMLNVPVYYVHTKVMADMFDGKFEMEELNRKYWELMAKYVGVGPPNDRVSNTFDFPFKFYIDLTKNLQGRKFTSEVLSFQFYKKLCSIADQYPNGDLQTCDLSDSTAAGDALKQMIKLGSSKPYPEVLASLLPDDPKLNAESLLEYYSPALKWLVEANEKNKVSFGWGYLDKRVDNVNVYVDPDTDDF